MPRYIPGAAPPYAQESMLEYYAHFNSFPNPTHFMDDGISRTRFNRFGFTAMPDTYTIFIIEKDFYGQGEAVHPIERINLATGKSFEDGEHILYVNSEYRGDSTIGKLMHDFNCIKADDMNFELMTNRTRCLKENPKGMNEMYKIMEDMRSESLKEVALCMLAAGKYALERSARRTGYTTLLNSFSSYTCRSAFL